MKTYLSFLAIVALGFTACTAPQGAASSSYNDDVYYSSKDALADKEKQKQQEQAEAQRRAEEAQRAQEAKQAEEAAAARSSSTSDPDDYYDGSATSGTTTQNATNITNNYYNQPFNADDYYDYEYATRLRRFHSNIDNYGYYDNYYTNSYWYSGDPYTYGTSVYMGYNFWGPSYYTYAYTPYLYWGTGFSYGYDPWYHPYYGYPYYSYGYGYGNPYGGYGYDPYMYGYGYGGYGYPNNYFNSYDNNSYNNSYYGPRGSTGSNGRTTSQPSLAHRYISATEAETKKPFEVTHGRENNPYMQATTVSDYMTGNARPVTIDKAGNETRPASGSYTPANNPGSKEPVNENRPVYNNRPATSPADRPVYNNKPATQPAQGADRPAYNNRPASQPAQQNDYYQRPQERPSHYQNQSGDRPEQYQPQQRTPAPSQDRGGYSTPQPAPAPQYNPGGGGGRGGSSPGGGGGGRGSSGGGGRRK